MKKRLYLLLASVMILTFFTSARANNISGAETLIKDAMAESLAIINNKAMTPVKKREQLWPVVNASFDFDLIAELTLGKFSANSKSRLNSYSDRRFSQQQQQTFSALFKKHLGNLYLDKLTDDIQDLKVDINPGRAMKPQKGMQRARINTVINDKTSIDYSLRFRDNQWQVYDVRVEGRSLVASFRKEYNALLLKQTPEELISILKKKT